MRLNVAALAVAALLAPIAGAQTGPPVVKKGRPPQAAPKETLDAIKATQSTANVSSPTSDVKGLAFDRIVQIWLENTNFEAAAGDPNFQWIASQGILLKNYFAVTHPSQPNYAAVVSGDNFGMDHDDFFRFPENISTVFDLLDTKSISWGAYQEHLPYAGYPGFNFSNQKTFANDYVRKHNPPIMFDSVTNKPERASQIKNFTSFYDDLKAKKLPQWSFVTPNMTNDGHDTNYRFSGRWAKGFLEPLLNNSYLTDRTLIILSFDESEVYTIQNRIFTVLLGGAVDPALRGTSDSMFYTHYSTIATVSANWGLPSLGRWDCGANILALVANKTNYANIMPAGIDGSGSGGASLFLNMTYPGPASNSLYTPGWWPAPDTKSTCSAGNGVLPAVVSAWSSAPGPAYNYSYAFPYDDRSHINTAVPPVRGSKASTAGGGGNSTVSGGGQSPTSGGGSTTGSSQPKPNVAGRAMGVPSVGALAAVAACSLIGV